MDEGLSEGDELSPDEVSVMGRMDAAHAGDASPVLLRRLRVGEAAVGVATESLHKEVSYAKLINSSHVANSNLEPLLSGKVQLNYEIGRSLVLRDLIQQLAGHDIALRSTAVVCIILDILKGVQGVQEARGRMEGHGCIDDKKFVVTEEGQTLLFDLRFPATGFMEVLKAETLPFRAPEFALGITQGTSQMDVYGVGSILASLLFGDLTDGTLNVSDYGDKFRSGQYDLRVDDGLVDVLSTALAVRPQERFENAKAMSEAIRNNVSLELSNIAELRTTLGSLVEELLDHGPEADLLTVLESHTQILHRTKQKSPVLSAEISAETQNKESWVALTSLIKPEALGGKKPGVFDSLLHGPTEELGEKLWQIDGESSDVLKKRSPVLLPFPFAPTEEEEDGLSKLPMEEAELTQDAEAFNSFREVSDASTELFLEEDIELLTSRGETTPPLEFRQQRGSQEAPSAIAQEIRWSLALKAALVDSVPASVAPCSPKDDRAAKPQWARKKRRIPSVVGTPIMDERQKVGQVSPLEVDAPLELAWDRASIPRREALCVTSNPYSTAGRVPEHRRNRQKRNLWELALVLIVAGGILRLWQDT